MEAASKDSDFLDLPKGTKLFLYFSQYLYGSANACYYSFLSIWLSFNGFTYTEIGYIRGLNQLSILIFVPILCLIIDLLSNGSQLRRQFLFATFCVIVASSRLLFIFWEHSWNVVFCVLIAVTIAFHESTNSTMDSIILSIIPDKNKYGRYRLWAGVGWGITAFSLGTIFDKLLSVNTMFYFHCGFMGSLGLIWYIPTFKDWFCNPGNNTKNGYKSSLLLNDDSLSKKPKRTTIEIDGVEVEIVPKRIGFCRKLCLFMKQINAFKLQIIFSIFVLGISFGVINTFLFLRLQELGASTLLMGLTLVVTICSEVPAFILVEHALIHIGDLGIVTVGLFAYMIRLGWYGLLGYHGIMTNPWYVLPAETLHGLTYSWIKASIAIFAYRLANNDNMSNMNMDIDWSSFSQGFLSAIFNGFGQGLGGVIGGIIFDAYGPHWLFFGNAAGLVPFFIIYTLQFCCCRNKLMPKPAE